jgi:hypothetical protein
VIAGALDDGPGTSITNAIETVAAAIQENILTDGREFELIEHYPGSLSDRDTPSFSRVRFAHRSIEENPDDPTHYAGTILLIDGEDIHAAQGRPIEGDFRDPKLEPIADIEQIVGCQVEVWPEGDYTAHTVAGQRGQQLRDEIAQEAATAIENLIDAVERGE